MVGFPDLQNPAGTGDEYEYSIGNLANSMAIAMPGQAKALLTLGFIGTDTELPVTVRKTNAATPSDQVATTA